MDKIMQAVVTLQQGDHETARGDLLLLWREWAERDAPIQRCVIAHYLADTESDVAAELQWDLLALEAATTSKDEADRDPVDPGLVTFLPSLHLNVGDAYRRLGEPARARRHAEVGLKRAVVLHDDGYARTVKGGLERLLARLES